MQAQERTALAEFARRHRVHYEVDAEHVPEGAAGELVGLQLRLFATHEREKLEAPGCRACVELLGDLRSFAHGVVGSGSAAHRAEPVPETPALYQSPDDRDADEVALTIRVRCDALEHRRPGAGEDRCLGEIKERLEAVGVPRR